MAYQQPDRYQGVLFPPTVDEFVPEDATVRAYDAMVEAMDLKHMGIEINHHKVGSPQYEPAAMLKLLVYGYSYGIRSSRKLERACYDNVSFLWLLGGLKPDHKTIAQFRRYNKKAIAKVIKQCARICIKLDLIAGNVLFLDGTKLRANASISNSYDEKKARKALKDIDNRVEKLLNQCEQTDQRESGQPSLTKMRKELKDARKLKSKIESVLTQLQAEDNDKATINTIDEDCARMHSRQGSHAGYNGQLVTDEKNGLIVNSDVVNDNNDLKQFANQITQANDVVEVECSVACADAGYSDYDELEKIDGKGIQVVVPSQKQASGKPLREFDKSRFLYDKAKDCYVCPMGKELKYSGIEKRDRCCTYRGGKQCLDCEHFGRCTIDKVNGRKVRRYFNEEFRKRIAEQYTMVESKALYSKRKDYAEHPFGHIKRNLNTGYFLLRGLDGVRAEMSLLANSFNIARLITLLGVSGLISKLNEI